MVKIYPNLSRRHWKKWFERWCKWNWISILFDINLFETPIFGFQWRNHQCFQMLAEDTWRVVKYDLRFLVKSKFIWNPKSTVFLNVECSELDDIFNKIVLLFLRPIQRRFGTIAQVCIITQFHFIFAPIFQVFVCVV